MRAFSFVLSLVLSGLAAAFASGAPAFAGQVTVAAASNVVEPLEVMAAQFTDATGHEVRIINGSTGKLYAQIRRGAPFDLFLAADQERPALLVQEGLTEGGAETYASGRLALWSAAASARSHSDNPDGDQGAGLRARLMAGKFRRLAIADPALAPYGLAAQQVLTALELGDQAGNRLVLGENIGQTFAFVSTGNADLGLVALSQLLSPRLGLMATWWEVPASLHAPIRQDAVLLRGAGDNPAARAFRDYLFGEPGQAVLKEFGYLTDTDPKATEDTPKDSPPKDTTPEALGD